jgi:glycosyltransferase involved in cell wall biosynthesis
MPILEGQAVGRPVLTSDREPMRSVAGDGGALLVDPLSVSSIRAGFRTLIASEEARLRLVTVGLDNVQRYSLAAVAESYRIAYQSLNES